jgi:hypothetical protein
LSPDSLLGSGFGSSVAVGVSGDFAGCDCAFFDGAFVFVCGSALGWLWDESGCCANAGISNTHNKDRFKRRERIRAPANYRIATF